MTSKQKQWFIAAGFVVLITVVRWPAGRGTSMDATATPSPRPTATFARIPGPFPLTDLPRKLDGSMIAIEDAATGVLQPDGTNIAVVPLNDGGSGGPTHVAWYGLRNHQMELLGQRYTGTTMENLAIANGQLTLRVAWYDPKKHSAHCCPDGKQVLSYGS